MNWRQRTLVLSAGAALLLPPARAQVAGLRIDPVVSSIPAGSYGASLNATVESAPQTLNFSVCFYTGYGSTSPIVPSSYTITGTSAALSLAIPASSIQDVPPSAFSAGSFAAQLYTVPVGTAACTGAAQAQGVTSPISIQFPTLTGLSLATIPELNPKLTGRAPTNLTLSGSGFLAQSTVSFIAHSTFAGSVTLISTSSLVSTIPLIPDGINPVQVQVCNSATYSYCTGTRPLGIATLPADAAVLTATPSAASPTQPVTLSATFSAAKPSVAGAPGGVVTFQSADVLLGTAPLVLNSTGTFVAAPATTVQSASPLISPVTADFNRDKIPDLMLVESATPLLHLFLGKTPSGSFAADTVISACGIGAGSTLLGVAVADLNNDGFADIAALCQVPGATGSTNVVYTLLNDGSGHFKQPFSSYGAVTGSRIVAGDFNHDGKQDLVIAGRLGTDNTTGLQVLLGDGTGAFTLGPATSGLNAAPSNDFGGYQIAAADLNNDGFPDILVLNGASADGSQVSKSLNVFRNAGDGTFTLAANLATDGTNSASFLIAALGAGQLPSILMQSTAPGSAGLSVALNQSTTSISFSDTLVVTSVADLKQAVAGDFNGDGLLDIAVDDGTAIHVLTGDGKGSFTGQYPNLTLPSVLGTSLLAASDENADTLADLLLLGNNGAGSNGTTNYSLQTTITSGGATATLPPLTFDKGTHNIEASAPGTFTVLCGTASSTITITAPTPVVTLSTSVPSPANYGTAGIALIATIPDPTATGTVTFYNGTARLGAAQLVDGQSAVATFTLPLLHAGVKTFSVAYPGDATHNAATSTITFDFTPIPAPVAWNPRVATIVYGTTLSASQLDATSKLAGTFVYTPASGALLTAGPQTLSATFTPTDTVDYTAATITTSITVDPAMPLITWPTPANIAAGAQLSATQLDATATGVDGNNLAGTFVYTPVSGTIITTGPQKLSVIFTPADQENYKSASGSVSLGVTSLSLGSLSSSTASLGDAAKTITLTGAGFIPSAKAEVNGTAIPTAFVNATTLSATIPLADFLLVQVLQISVDDGSQNLISNALPLTVTAPDAAVNFSGPATVSPGTQSALNFELTTPYPVDLVATFTIAFTPSTGLPDDPTAQFQAGGRTLKVTIPAGTTTLDPIGIQSGTVAGTLTISTTLEAGGVNVTPANVKPVTIEALFAVPGITSVSFTTSGSTLTVAVRGFSNTREIAQAKFHFNPVAGGSIGTQDVTIDATALYASWYGSAASAQYGSTCTYTQIFNLSSDASVVGQVSVILVNSQGASQEAKTP